jgi:hypothetical protein
MGMFRKVCHTFLNTLQNVNFCIVPKGALVTPLSYYSITPFLNYPIPSLTHYHIPIAFKNSSLLGFTLEAKKWVSVPFSSRTYLQKFHEGSWLFQPFCAGSVSH